MSDSAVSKTPEEPNKQPPLAPREGLREGDIIQGKYRVQRVLGRGGMGVVVAAEHLQLRETVALKVLTRRDEGDLKEFQGRFQREARITAKLRGEHVVRTLDFGLLEDGTPFMVMEFLEGVDLRQILRTQGAFPLERAFLYMVQVCEGLAEAHGLGIIHRDLKPSNLFLTSNFGGAELVKVLDFGVSKLDSLQEEGDEPLTATGVLLGSPRYMSPEQLQSQLDQMDMRSDVWALGTILYELLVGQPLFTGTAAPAICAQILGEKPIPKVRASRPELPEIVDTIIAGCLERDPARRTPSVAVLAGQLLDALNIPSEQVVNRLTSMVERRPGSSGGGLGMLSGSYPTPGSLGFDALSRSSSTLQAPPSSSSSRIPVSSPSVATASGGAALSTPPPGPSPAPRTGLKIGAAVAALALLGGAYWVQRAATTESTPATSTVLPSTSAAAPVATAATPPESATAAPPGASAAPAASTAPQVTADPPPKIEPKKTGKPAGKPAPRPATEGPKGNVLDERL